MNINPRRFVNLIALLSILALALAPLPFVKPSARAAGSYHLYLPALFTPCGSQCPYYISSSTGSDANSGRDPGHPLKTIAKVNSLNLIPGDQVLFNCGDVWRGEMLTLTKSGAAGNPIRYASYPQGCTDRPRLDGTQPVTGWTLSAAHIYVADLNHGANLANFRSPDGSTSYAINQVFRAGQRLTMGRWPNLDAGDGGYASVDAQPAANKLTDAQLPAGPWTGATLHLKVIRWSMINRDVSAQNGTTLTLNANAACPYTSNCSGWGYFINNSLKTLDQEGEWYYDKAARKLYLYTAADPNSSLVEASVVFKSDDRSWGAVTLGTDLDAPVHDLVVDNFDLRGWFRSGIASPTNLHPDENSSLTLSNNTIRDVDDTGIDLWSWVWGASDGKDGWRGGHDISIQGNTIDGANSFGIHTPSRQTAIQYNTIRNIGLIPNLGEAGMGCGKTGNEGACTEDGAGLRIYVDQPDRSGYGFTVSFNRFENIAYSGIQTFGSSSTFSFNIFDHTCIAKGDGGAINTFGNDNLATTSAHDIQILSNIILYTLGNTDGTAPNFRPLFGFGIYIDNGSRDILTSGNTVAYSTVHGILYQRSTGRVENNILFDNDTGSLWGSQVDLGGSPAALATFNGNILASYNAHTYNLSLPAAAGIAAADNNRYYHSLQTNMQVNLNSTGLTLAQWQSASGKDAHAKTGTTAFAASLQLYVNDTAAAKTITASGGVFTDLDGSLLGASFLLPPYSSRVVAFVAN